MQRSEVASARVSLRNAVLKLYYFGNSVQYHDFKFNFEFTNLFCPEEKLRCLMFMLVFLYVNLIRLNKLPLWNSVWLMKSWKKSSTLSEIIYSEF